MKKSRNSILLILLSALTLLLFSCNSWMTDDGFFSSIEKDVKVANAPQISVYVRYAMTKQGKTDPDGPATLKVEIPYSISATTETEYGFVRWAAFSTDFLATGDNQSLNKDVIFNDEDDYNTRLLPHEIRSPIVVFEDATKPSTMVTINELRNDIFLVPIVTQRPSVSLTIPSRGTSDVVRNTSVRISFSKPMDINSFKNSEGEFDKITITQGNQTVNSDGDVDIESEDITDRFDISLSRNKKMLTLKFKTTALAEGFKARSSVNVNISKEVKDLYGYSMTDDDKVTFSVGIARDSLAPYIVQLTGGTGYQNTPTSPLINYYAFKGIYKDANCTATNTSISKIIYDGAVNAPTDDMNASWYETKDIFSNRVGNKIILRVVARDIAGSDDSTQVNEQTSSELDVQTIGVRAQHLYNAADGSVSGGVMSDVTSYNYAPKTNQTSITGSYVDLVTNSNSTENEQNEGCLLEYSLDGMPNGLIRIDVAAIDVVGNNGFDDGGMYSSTFGNAWTSLFVVKDSIAPDAAANLTYVQPELSGTVPSGFDNYYNASTYQSIVIKESTAHIIRDQNLAKLASGKNGYGNLKWMFKATTDLNWPNSVNRNSSGWALISDTNGYNFQNFALPVEQGTVSLSYALMDDLGNISSAVALNSINYDDVAPAISSLTMPSVISGQTVDLQFTAVEETSGIKSLDVTSVKSGAGAYNAPLTNAELWINGEQKTRDSDFTVSGTKIIFTTPLITPATGTIIQIKNIKIDSTASDGRYTISVTPKDRALNQPAAANVPSVIITHDHTAPVINSVVPKAGLKKIKTFSGTTLGSSTEYWSDSASTEISSGRASVEITFRENNSGAKVFDFGSSSLQVTASSTITNKATGEVYPVESTITGNKLTLINPIVTPEDNSTITVVVSNIQLTSASSGNNISFTIYDAAGNHPENISYFTVDSVMPTVFYYDSATPSFNGVLTLSDPTNPVDPEYTNEPNVNATFSTLTASSGIYKITVSGATFTNATGIYVYGSNNYTQVGSNLYEITSNTIEFKSGSTYGLFRSATSFKITNVLLPGGDSNPAGTAATSVSFTLTSMGGTSAANTDTIILDMVAPQWGTDGLYTTTTSESIYPRSPDGVARVSGLTGIDPAHTNEYYFYTNGTVVPIYADFTDANLTANADSCVYVSVDDGSISDLTNGLHGPYGHLTLSPLSTSKLTVYIKDKAGNQSTSKVFNLVRDDAFATTNENANIDNYFILYMPSGANIFRNPIVSGGQTRYILKGGSQYQIRVKLNGAAAETGEVEIGGGTIAYSGPYSRKDNTTTSSKIESYSIASYNIASYPTSGWHSYSTTPAITSNSNTVNGTSITSGVTSDGTIIINLPTDSCDPLVLLLKDACGNTVGRHIRPASMTNSNVRWDVDSAVGLPSYDGTQSLSCNVGSAIITSDIAFYNQSISLTTGTWSDSARYQTANNYGAAGTDSEYTLKSRIIAWTGSTPPTRDSFDDANLADASMGSDWYHYKESFSDAGGATNFSMENTFPQYSATTGYKLFYCVEDKVGNYLIKQIKLNSSNHVYLESDFNDNSGLGIWLYDGTAPSINTNSYHFEKVNQITENGTKTNYFSNYSYVTYTINETGSGIRNNGNGDTSYSSFDSRSHGSAVSVTYSFNDKTAANLISGISIIKDWAGNTVTNIPLNYENSSNWYKQTSAPVLNTTVIDTTGATASWANDSSSDCQHLEITAKSKTTAIDLTLGVTDTTTPLLGWIVKTEAENASFSPADFYTAADMSSDVTVSASNTYTYTYSKSSEWTTQWKDDTTAGVTKYFYPVNRAGLIGNPLKVEFVDNPIPSIDNDELIYNTYGAIDTTADSPTNYSITSEGSGSNAIYYLKSGAKLRFTTVNNPTTACIYYGSGEGDKVTYTLSYHLVSGNTYEIPLDESSLQTHISSTTGTALRLTVHTNSEDSDYYEMTGPGPQSNKWVYDGSSPSISSGNFISVGYDGPDNGTDDDVAATVSGDTTNYIQSDTTRITLTYSDTGVSGIAHYQWKVGTAAWADIGTALTTSTGVVQFTAPASKTAYQFRVIDRAGNISTPTTAVTIQKDKWGPAGNFAYTTNKSGTGVTNPGAVALTTDTSYTYDNGGTTVTDENIRIIKYSSSTSSAFFINSIELNLSEIHDKRDENDNVSATGIERSGMADYLITVKEGNGQETSYSTPAANANSASISLTGNSNAVYEYKVWAYDKIGNKTLLKTFRTQDDNEAPSLTNRTIFADTAKTIAAVPSNATSPADQTMYLKGDKAVITFTHNDYAATYRWSNDGTNWNTTNVTKAASTVTYTFDAPPSKTYYYFQAEDGVGNISSTSTALVLQRDEWAPDGTVDFQLFNGETEKAKNTLTKPDGTSLITESGSGETASVEIKYSSSSTAGSSNYLTTMKVDFNAITDVVDSQDRSGISGYYVSEDNGTATLIPSSSIDSGKYTITLPTSGTKTYAFSVEDNIGYRRTLKTFTLKPDGTKPDLALTTTGTVTTDSQHSVYYKGTINTYYTNGTNAIINFTKSATDIVKYELKEGDADWADITSTTGLSSGTSHTLAAPDTAITYKFRATDAVGNVSTEQSVTIVKDSAVPELPADKSIGISFKKGDSTVANDAGFSIISAVDSSTTPPTVTISYNAYKINKVVLDVSEITDAGSGLQSITNDANVAISSNTFTFTTAGTYTIKAKDNCNNEGSIMKYVLKAITGISVPQTQNPPYSGLQYVPTYNPETGAALAKANANTVPSNGQTDYRIKAFNTDSSRYSMSTTPTEKADNPGITIYTYDNGWPNTTTTADLKWNYLEVSDGTTFTLPFDTTSLPSNKLWYAITYHSIVQPASWTDVSSSADFTNGKIEGIAIDLSKIEYRHTFIFVWYKNEIGNISVYNLVNPASGKQNQNWWSKAAITGNSTADDFDNFKYTSAATYQNIQTIGGQGDGTGNTTGISDITDSYTEGTRSIVTQFINTVQDFFTNTSETASDNAVNEKSVKKSKKTAKKAKKTAKKSDIAKVPAETIAEQPISTITEPAEQVSAPVINELTASDITTVGEALSDVTVIENVTPEVTSTSAAVETAEIAPAASADSEATAEKSSSKTSVIVVMIAILAACGGAWFTLSRRKK